MHAVNEGQRVVVPLQDADDASLSAPPERYDVSLSWVARQPLAEFFDQPEYEELRPRILSVSAV